jgi:hypothetical protein
MRGLFIGQSYDIYWTRESLCPSVTEYLHMVDGSKDTIRGYAIIR